MFTKIEAQILMFFSARLSEKFNILEVSKSLKKPYSLIHRSIQSLLSQGFLLRDRHNLLSLNIIDKATELGYIETLRRGKISSKILDLGDSLKIDDTRSFIIYLRNSDEFVIVSDKIMRSKVRSEKKINLLNFEEAYNMITNTNNSNLMNRSLNDHIILCGAEGYYRLLSHGRK